MIPGAQGLQLLIKIKILNVDISHGDRIKERINKGEKMKINKRKRKLDFNAADAREWLESRADLGGVLMCLIDGTFSPSDVAKEISTHKKEQEEDRTLSLRIQRNADWIKQQNKEID
jgi:hypothetical protein